METFRSVPPLKWSCNPFTRIGSDWMLIGAYKGEKLNMMTASWGGLGILWNKPVAFLFIRPQRYTKEFVDASSALSLHFFTEDYREQLTLCGSRSGRDIDKTAACGFSLWERKEAPVFEQAETVLLCHKLYTQSILPEGFFDSSMEQKFYPGQDYHQLYIAEISEVLIKNEAAKE